MYMTMRRIQITAIWAGLALAMASCGVFNKSAKTQGPDTAEEPILPHDREVISPDADNRSYNPEEIKKGVVKGEWSIQEVYGKDAVGEKAPYLRFVPGMKRVYGNNGCNTLNATYKYNPADSTLSFGNTVTTMTACAKEGLTDTEINQALAATVRYTWGVSGSEYYLDFYDKAGRKVMTLMHQNFDFLNGTWQVTAIGDLKIDVPDMKIMIDVDEGKLHGNTGCNILNGRMYINMEEANSISFSAIAVTRMACPDMNHETSLIVALEEATAARPVSPVEVLLFNAMGKKVLTLQRVKAK